ncbi:MAG: 3-hydroxybutyryl-CoA dehydrogenase, partial [Cyanobacteria bacterium PR.3.49]|nr:3-hydroxybutyryl-CoA dehydrogenase [Cyanobacteria bacterium PR.3.49]
LIATRTKAKVYIYDISKAALRKANENIEKYGRTSIDKKILDPEDVADAQRRIVNTERLQDAVYCDLVIEAIAENLDVKQKLFKELDEICDPKTMFASNTSSLSITSIAAATKRSDRVLGMHFFSPAHVMKLVELIPGFDTSDTTMSTITKFGEELGKTLIRSKDMPGFITTRLGLCLINEAAFALMEGLSTPEDIDQGMKLGYNHPMGPLELGDFVGLDIVLHVMEVLQEGFGDPKYRPCPVIKQLVNAGHLGRKTGRGFYVYAPKEAKK